MTALGLSSVLAAVAGYVDAVGFARLLGVFPANQNGNVVFLGMAIGGSSPAPGWRTATAIVSFAVGAAAGFLLGRRVGHRHKGPVLLAIELLLLVLLVVIAGPIDEAGPVAGLEGGILTFLASFAMGLETEVIRHVAGVAVATTYQSGAVARIGEVMTGALRPGTAARRYAGELGILVFVLFAYIGGAAVGATDVGQWRWAFTVPCAAVAVLVVVWVFLLRGLGVAADDLESAPGE